MLSTASFQHPRVRRSLRHSLRMIASAIFAILLASTATPAIQAQQPSAVANPARITQPVDDTVLTTLKGNVHPLARAQYDTGPANASLPADRMELVLKRSSGQEIALRQFLSSLQNPNSSQYRKWLTPEQFGAQYGVSDADIQTISAWLTAQGFKVAKVNKAHTLIEFSGSIGQLETAFHTQIHNFTVDGEQHLANVSDPQIPTALAPVVAGLSSLTNFFPKPQHTKPVPAKFDKATGRMAPLLTTGSAESGYSLYLVPGDAATIYDTPNSFNINFKGSTSYTGSNIMIGIAGDSNISTSDVLNYRSLFGESATAPTVVVDGNDPGINGDVIEALLDLEVSGGLAPSATQIFYTAADTNLDSGLFLAIYRALDDNTVSILNVSFGGCEADQGTTGNQDISNLWEQAAAQGISVTVSSDDSGSAGCDSADTEEQAQFGLAVNGLASTPFNIAVGGTDFDVLETDFTKYAAPTSGANYESALGFIPEEPWNNSTASNGLLSANTAYVDSSGDTNIAAGGGGASSCVLPQYDSNGDLIGCGTTTGSLTGWPKPSWQTGGSLNIPSDGVRDLPDLSLFAADGFYGAAWLVCADIPGEANTCVQSGTGFEFYAVGGTSSSAPAFAGMLALISQSQGGARLGQANYVLYNLANQSGVYSSAFHDTTTGNNSVYCVSGSTDCLSNLFESGYNTGTGYDQASGLGSVDVAQLIDDWNKATFTSTTTSFTINGGTSSVSITHGQSVTFNAAVTGANGTPTGDVAIVGNANQQANTYNSNAYGFITLSGGTTGAVTFNNLPGGTYNVSANYGGDIAHAQSQSSGVQVTVAKEDSIVDLFAANGSSTGTPPTSSPYGTYFSLEAQPIGVNEEGSSNPPAATGTVTFTDTAGLPTGVSGSVAINSAGYAELPVYYWTAAAHDVTASYGGDNSFDSSSATASFTITKAPTSSAVTSSTSSVSGGTFTVTSLITPTPLSEAANPTGTVTLTANGSTIGSGSVTATTDANDDSLATATVTVNASSLASGANTITATYSGDGNYVGSSGTVVVTSTGSTTPSLTVSGSSVAAITAGSSGTSTVTVTPGGDFTGAVNLTASISPTTGTSVPTLSFNPASVTISGTTAATSTLTIATTSTTTAGSYTVTLNAADAATGKITATGTISVTVTGVATGSFALTNTAATVSSPGQSGTSTITITPSGGYTGTVNLTCVLTTSPSGADATYNPTCSLSASSVKITSSTAATATSTFATTAATSGALAYPKTNRWYTATGGAALACMLFFGIPARRRSWKSMLSLLVFLAAMAGVGCGGGGNNNNGTPGTTTGTYTFTVTGTDSVTSSTTGTTVVTVTVN